MINSFKIIFLMINFHSYQNDEFEDYFNGINNTIQNCVYKAFQRKYTTSLVSNDMDTKRISKELGRGAFGIVYQDLSEREQVIKVIPIIPEKDQSKIVQEISILDCFNHEISDLNIVTKYVGLSIDDDNFYITLKKYSPFKNLAKEINNAEMNLINGMMLKMEYLHNLGIIHNDIKPDNFLAATDNSDIIFADLGLVTNYAIDDKSIRGTIKFSIDN